MNENNAAHRFKFLVSCYANEVLSLNAPNWQIERNLFAQPETRNQTTSRLANEFGAGRRLALLRKKNHHWILSVRLF